MKFRNVATSLFLLLGTAVAQQPGKVGSIEGVVIRTGTDVGIANAQVSLTRQNDTTPVEPRPAAVAPVTTDATGRFSFKAIIPGRYRIAATASGYVRQEYGSRIIDGVVPPVTIAGGQVLKDLRIPLTQTATAVGKITDAAGEPLANVAVQLVRVRYSYLGKRYELGNSGTTNDRGEYRIFGVTPGRYYVQSGDGQGARDADVRWATAYYPGVADLDRAVEVDLQSGVEARANFSLQRQQSYRVRGRVIDAATGQAPPIPAGQFQLSTIVALVYCNFNSCSSLGAPKNYDRTTGVFDFERVPPGAWTVEIRLPRAVTLPPSVATSILRVAPEAFVPLSITDSDIEGLVVALTPETSLPGRVRIEGQSLSIMKGVEQIRVQFRPTARGRPDAVVAQVGADGTFIAAGLRRGEYLVNVNGIPSGLYLKGVRYLGDDIVGKPFAFKDTGSGSIEVVLGSGAARITGSVVDKRMQFVSGAAAILIPEHGWNRLDMYETATTDETGRFEMSELPPGNYRIFSWDVVQLNSWHDPEFLRKYEQQGLGIQLTEGLSLNVEVRMISTQ